MSEKMKRILAAVIIAVFMGTGVQCVVAADSVLTWSDSAGQVGTYIAKEVIVTNSVFQGTIVPGTVNADMSAISALLIAYTNATPPFTTNIYLGGVAGGAITTNSIVFNKYGIKF